MKNLKGEGLKGEEDKHVILVQIHTSIARAKLSEKIIDRIQALMHENVR